MSDAIERDLGHLVSVFDPATPAEEIQAEVDEAFAAQVGAQFGTARRAFLFKPGRYELDMRVGFYTQVLGLGESPGSTTIVGKLESNAAWRGGNALVNFWRGAENLAVEPAGGTMKWAVSQAAPLRRLLVRGSLALDDGGWSSGGFLADSTVEGELRFGGQQQWFARNSRIGPSSGKNWNLVFAGVEGAPPGDSWPEPSHSVVEDVPRIREKPFIYIDENGEWRVFVPAPLSGARGCGWAADAAGGAPGLAPAGEARPLSSFHIARPESSDSRSLNAALERGESLLLTPGIYLLDEALRVREPGTVVLGMGFPTLVPTRGDAAIRVADADGVVLAGVLVDAGPVESTLLVELGPPGSRSEHSVSPSSIHDLFFRVGGAAPGTCSSCLEINSSDVIIDHAWIWRADHGLEGTVGWELNAAKRGLVVSGDRVTAYGLFVEHFQEYQALWEGEAGSTFFYQCELPYDPPSQAAWRADCRGGWAGYKVAEGVRRHEARGLGIYCYFRVNPSLVLESAVEAPEAAGVRIRELTIVALGADGGTGSIAHPLNGRGDSVGPDRRFSKLKA